MKTPSDPIYLAIKRQNGERFAQTIRRYDNGIFDIPNIVHRIRYAGRDATPLLEYLESIKNSRMTSDYQTDESPFELLAAAGYHAEYADTMYKKNAISRYFAPGEELCTFNDDMRHQNYYIINAVRHDADTLRRSDFTVPQRQDAYGTSVISIQMTKTGGFISIKNRYNHAVPHPDNTFDSDPDQIIPGLSASLKKYFDVDFNCASQLPGGYTLIKNQIVKYNFEINDVYYGDTFYTDFNKIIELNRDYELMMDYMVFDLHRREFTMYPRGRSTELDPRDDFRHVLPIEIGDTPIQTTSEKLPDGTIVRCLYAHHTKIAEMHNGQIIRLNLPHSTRIGDAFMMNNRTLIDLQIPRVAYIGDYFLLQNRVLPQLEINADTIGTNALSNNTSMTKLTLNTSRIGYGFMDANRKLTQLILKKKPTDIGIQNNYMKKLFADAMAR